MDKVITSSVLADRLAGMNSPYEVGYCDSRRAGATIIVGPFPDRYTAVEWCKQRNAQEGNNDLLNAPGWFWSPWNYIDREKGCLIVLPEHVVG